MSYTIMLWLVNPGSQNFETEAIEHTAGQERTLHPGAISGVTVPPARTRLVYGVYENEQDAASVLDEIQVLLGDGRALRLRHTQGHEFLIPAAQVHYAVMAHVQQPFED